jgi:pimeloyl-ACP methyl ester carboxylesterase
MATEGVVLVHGGTHTSSCWEYLLPLIDAPSRAVDLPGRGSRPADLAGVTLGDCVEAVIDEANAAGFTRFALVGHSLGGVTITETAYLHPGRISHLVYVGALVPPPGSSASILMTGAPLEAMTPMSEERAKTLFGNDLTEEQWAHHFRSIVPDAVGIMNAKLSGYPSDVPITYVNMSQDVPVPPALAQEMAANLGPGVQRRTIDAGHTVMVSRPKELAEIINEVIGQTAES